MIELCFSRISLLDEMDRIKSLRFYRNEEKIPSIRFFWRNHQYPSGLVNLTIGIRILIVFQIIKVAKLLNHIVPPRISSPMYFGHDRA